MAGIVSKNPFDLLGNDPELDPDREPEPPTKVLDKPVPRSGKRNAGGEAPAGRGAARGRGGTRGGAGDAAPGNEQAFRDRGAGSAQNRSHPPDAEGRADRPRGEHRGRGRGSRGRGAPRSDRHPNRTGITNDHEKSAEQFWGAKTGEAELADEKAGDAIAKEEEKEGGGEAPAADEGAAADDSEAKPDGEGDGAEPEGPKQVSYETYLAEQARKKLDLGGGLAARKPNEGSTQAFEGKEFKRTEAEETFFAGAGPKARRERAPKDKLKVDLEGQFYRPPETDAGRGGRGGRGGRPRARDDARGGSFAPRGRGDGAPRGGRGEGAPRGGRGRGGDGRGDHRGSRGRGPSGPNVDDQTAFPSLGA